MEDFIRKWKSLRGFYKENEKNVLSMTKAYDLIVLGAGPAGVKAAVECASRGFRVGLVDPKE